jgi:Arc/MetJ family transcription regulator
MHSHIDSGIRSRQIVHMRTTITITEDLLREAKQISGRSDDSEAISTSLEDYVALRKRLALLEDLFSHKTPHSRRTVKAGRRKRRWSA